MKDGFFRIGAASPKVRPADTEHNINEILSLIKRAFDKGCGAVCFPELSVTGYTCGDVFGDRLLVKAAEDGLRFLLNETKNMDIICAAGVPVYHSGALYNCCAVFHKGRLLGLIAKKNVSALALRQFAPAPEGVIALTFAGQETVLGTVLFGCENVDGLCIGVDLENETWCGVPASFALAKNGASVILAPACGGEIIGKAERRRELAKSVSRQTSSAYVRSESGFGESTTDLVFAGHDIICENGDILKETEPFSDEELITADIDLERIAHERSSNYCRNCCTNSPANDIVKISFAFDGETIEKFETDRVFPKLPFVPEDEEALKERCELILKMQSNGLAVRLSKIGCKTAVVAVSGGLDSTLALLVTARAFDILGLDRSGIIARSMPCFGTTGRTKNNAAVISREIGADFKEIPIGGTVMSHFKDIGHDPAVTDVTYENAQARERTQVAMDIANQVGGIVIGTGDLSELALGWATYNGDHMSMYAVNGSVPKTLVRRLVKHEADRLGGEGKTALKEAVYDILDTPVSPELLPPRDGETSQKTEELVGPYELHDFFLYHMLRYGFAPGKIYRMACRAFEGDFEPAMIKKWLSVFYRRFFSQQFKRSCMPDGPKIGSVSLSPRGDFMMPSDASAKLWLDEIEKL